MARANRAQIEFDALTIEGGLLPPEWLAKIAALDAPAQTPADYGIPKGLQLRDEIGRYWRIAEAIWAEFANVRANVDAFGATRRLAGELLIQAFGFVDLAPAGERVAAGRTFPIAFESLEGRVPVVVGSHTEEMDQSVPRHGDGSRRRSGWGVLQEYLNAAEWARWGVATNGLTLRIGRDNASLTRPAWFEADLERIFTEQRYADFSVLWLVLHTSRFGRADRAVDDCPLEHWRDAGREEGSRARETLRAGVEQALLALGYGFLSHPSNTTLRAALASGELSPLGYFNELLRLVYRMIFLLTVEERGILHIPSADATAVRLYATGYGMRRLRERAVRHAAHDRQRDLWESVRPVFAGLGRAEGEPLLGLPGLGGLFAADQCLHVDRSVLENRALLTAIFRLAWLREGDALARVNWKDMGVEEFGSVYESLLELVPVVTESGRGFAFAAVGEDAGNARKVSGSYYTPDALVQQLLDTVLEPVVAARLAACPTPADAEGAILSLSVVDPACGSAHFLLAAARRLAAHLARLRVGGTPGAAEYRYALRDVVTHCVYGVDRNPMALELARMALWLEAHTPDHALGFLDHHLVCGDALLGLLDLEVLQDGIPDAAYKALTGDDKVVARTLAKLNRAGREELKAIAERQQLPLRLGTQPLADSFARLDVLADDSLAGVEAKRARYASLQLEAQESPLAVAADCFMGAFLLRKRLPVGVPAVTDTQAADTWPTTATLALALDGTLAPTHVVAVAARNACHEARVFHWPLAFPQIFARGGFDVVLGNPPWDVSQLSEEEFFAARAPDVALLAGARRKAAISRLQAERPHVWQDYLDEKAGSEAANTLYRANPRFALTAFGRVNTYALFAETMYRIAARGGRAGMVVPTGIATDNSTKAFFGEIVDRGRLVSLFDFENRDGLFPSVDSRYKLSLLTLGSATQAEFAFYATNTAQLHDKRRRFGLTAADFRLINPNTRTCPTFRSEYDADLTKRIYHRLPVLIDEAESEEIGNPWRLSFSQGLFNMTSDSGLFADASMPSAVPLYEAKMIHQFDHRWATYANGRDRSELEPRDLSPAEKMDSRFAVRPRYWVAEDEVCKRLADHGWTRSWLLGWRDVCRATDERTVIASVIPKVGVGDKFLLMFPDKAPTLVACLLADQNSIPHDFVARQKIGGTSLKYFTKRQLTNVPPDEYSAADQELVVPRVLELTYTADDLAPWARDLGHDGPPFVWDSDRRAVLRSELDAFFARRYGLTRDDLRYILDPSDVMGPDYPSETFRVLKKNEQRRFGEYRTRRLVLEAWDRLFGK
jgi:hypothetical protein